MRTFNPPDLEGFIKILNGFYDPLNRMLESVIPMLTFGMLKTMPTLTWMGKTLPVTEGILSGIFILLYFVFVYLSTLVRMTDKQIENTASIIKYNQESLMRQEEKKKEVKKVVKNVRVLMILSYSFSQNATAAEMFNTYGRHGAHLVQSFPSDLLLEFTQPEQALEYAQQSARNVLNYYASLRPMDPQPPFKLALHVVGEQTDLNQETEFCRQMVYFAGNNKIIFSDAFRLVLDARGIALNYRYSSLGYYQFAQNIGSELYNLESR
jgi:Ca2+/Na+ antiporter